MLNIVCDIPDGVCSLSYLMISYGFQRHFYFIFLFFEIGRGSEIDLRNFLCKSYLIFENQYNVHVHILYSYLYISLTGFHNTFCIIHGLDSYWDYLLTVQANVDPYNASQTTIKIKTNESGTVGLRFILWNIQKIILNSLNNLSFSPIFIFTAPGKVSAFKVTQDINITAKTNVFIKWKSPALRDLNGVIQKYYLQYWYQPNKKVVRKLHFFNGLLALHRIHLINLEKAYQKYFQILSAWFCGVSCSNSNYTVVYI